MHTAGRCNKGELGLSILLPEKGLRQLVHSRYGSTRIVVILTDIIQTRGPRNLQYLWGARLPNDQLSVRFLVRCSNQYRREYPYRNSETNVSPVVSSCEAG